jgi:hypothetical protein
VGDLRRQVSVVFATPEILAEFQPLSPRAVAESAPPKLVDSPFQNPLQLTRDHSKGPARVAQSVTWQP